MSLSRLYSIAWVIKTEPFLAVLSTCCPHGFWAVGELGRLGYITTTFTGNVPDFDILVADKNLKAKFIQVKTIQRGGAFQSNVDKWMNITSKKKKQIILGKARISTPGLIHIMVVLGDKYGEDEFYWLTKRQLQKAYFQSYSDWLKEHGGIRPRKPESHHCSVCPEELKAYRINWEEIIKKKSIFRT